MYVVTGLGRSGTSFISEILKECGLFVGNYYNNDVNAGYEHPDVVKINKKILEGCFWGDTSEISEMNQITNSLSVAKDPRFILTLGNWIRYGANIEGVFFCQRNIHEILHSSERSNAGMMSIFNGLLFQNRKIVAEAIIDGFMQACEKHSIEVNTIHYPNSINDFNEINCLSKIVNDKDVLSSAWKRTRRPKEISVKRSIANYNNRKVNDEYLQKVSSLNNSIKSPDFKSTLDPTVIFDTALSDTKKQCCNEFPQLIANPETNIISHEADNSNNHALIENSYRPRIIGMLRIKNEATWIASVLDNAADLVDGFIILDYGSTDDTPAICRAHPKMLRYEWQDETETDEVRDKNRLLRWTLEAEPDWVISLDGEEVIEDVAAFTIRHTIQKISPEITKLGINFLYMWDKDNVYRIDGHYREVRHPRVFRVSGLPIEPADLSFSPSRYGANFHCGSVPANLPGETLYIDVRVKHYGYFSAQQRAAKNGFYELSDPENDAAGYYDHLTATQNIKLRPYQERTLEEVLQFDGTAAKAIAALKTAGNPLWQSALFYSPDCYSHLDIGTNHGNTLKGLNSSLITSIEAYAPAAERLKGLFPRVLQGDARKIVMQMATEGQQFDRITLFDFIEHIPKEDGEELLTQLEILYAKEIILFVPIETKALEESEEYQIFRQKQFDRVPNDQHALQSHRAHWSPEDFESRGYGVTMMEDFHMTGFHAFFAYKYFTRTTAELIGNRVEKFLESNSLSVCASLADKEPFKKRVDYTGIKLGRVGANSQINMPLILKNPEHVFIGNQVLVREDARIEAITHYGEDKYQPRIEIGDQTHIGHGVHIGAAESVRIGQKVIISGRVTVLDYSHEYRIPLQPPMDQPLEVSPVVIENGAWIGENAVICKGVTVGQNAVIGANSVITQNVLPWSVVSGSPARLTKFYNRVKGDWETVPDRTNGKASIIIPVFNHVDYTRACLNAVLKNTPKERYDIIVVDNASTDGTAAYLARLPESVRVIQNQTNRGFVEACNQGAAEAQTPYLVFLNNDTEPRKGWLENLIKAVEHDPEIGAAGSKLIYPDGRLQEAGAVVFSDGTAKNFGRGENPEAPLYNRPCEVDYCSGASLLVRRDLFHALGGFDQRYAPAYYEETDFCFQLRAKGYRILYVPGSEVIHHGSVTAGIDESRGFRKYLAINRKKFVQKWQAVLGNHEAPLAAGESIFSSDRRLLGLRKSVLLSVLAPESLPPADMRPDAPQLLTLLYQGCQTLIQQGRDKEAWKALHDLIQFAPDFALARNDMGVLHFHQGANAKAAAYYRSAVMLEPQNFTFRKNLADLLWLAMHQPREALAEYLVVLQHCPEDLEALTAVGYISLQNGQPGDAQYFFNRILEIDPANSAATEGLEKAMANDVGYTFSHDSETSIRYRQILSLRDEGRVEEAITALETWIKQEPADARAWSDLGIFYMQAGTASKAGECLEKAAALQPHNVSILRDLAGYYFTVAKQIPKAWAVYDRLVDLCPQNETALWEAAQIAALANERPRGLELCQQILKLNPEHSEVNNLRKYALEDPLLTDAFPADKTTPAKRPRIAIVSSRAPQIDCSSADLRIHHIVKMMAASGSEILFLHPSASSQPRGGMSGFTDNVTVRFLQPETTSYVDILSRFKPDTVWMTNLWHLPYVEFLARLIDALSAAYRTRIIVDTMDFHHKKYARKHRLSGRIEDLETSRQFFNLEEIIYHKADAVVAVTETEAQDIRQTWPAAAPIEIIPNIHPAVDRQCSIKDRRHICFLGNFEVNHNRDAARHFVDTIYPLIKEKMPQIEFHLIGIGSEPLATDLGSEGVRGLGFVQDLETTLSTYLVFACPMIYGAGMKGKIGVAATAGLPVVTTSIGVEGFPMDHGEACLIADEPELFASACLQLMRDPVTWHRLQKNAAAVMAKHFSPAAVASKLKAVLAMPGRTPEIPATGSAGVAIEMQPKDLSQLLSQKGWSHKESIYASRIASIEHPKRLIGPSISIVIITWRFHPDTLQCLAHLEKERHLNYELIMVDNGTAPGELAALHPYADTLIRLRENTGTCIARNIGALYAQAPILLFIDDDALPAPHLIAAHLDAHANYDVISVRGACHPRNPENAFNILGQHYYLGDRPLPRYADIEGNTSYQSRAFYAAGGWDDELFFGHEGIVLALRLWRYDNDRRKQIYSPDPVIYHDYAASQEHLDAKQQKQWQSRQQIEDRYPNYVAFVEDWEQFAVSNNPIRKQPTESAGSRQTSAQRDFPSRFEADPAQTFVSIVIPTHNRAQLLQAAIESALSQTYPNFEVVVIDDASQDETPQVVRAFASERIRYIRKEHSGAPDTRNRGIKEARGEFILWLDDDDLLMPEALENQVRVAQANPAADVIYGQHVKFDHASSEIIGVLNPKDWSLQPAMLLNGLLGACPIPNPATMVRRDTYRKIGGYDLSFSRAHDYEFWSRAVQELTFIKNHAVLCRYRVHTTNMSTGQFIDQSFESRIVRRMVVRYGFPRLFPRLNWEMEEEARTVACFLTAERLFELNDYYNALKFIGRIPEKHFSIDVMALHVQCVAYLQKRPDVDRLIAHYQKHRDVDPSKLSQIKQRFQYYFDNLQSAQQHIQRKQLKQAAACFQAIVKAEHPPSAATLLLGGYLFNPSEKSGDRFKRARKTVQCNPSRDIIKDTLEMLGDPGFEQELEAIRQRIISDSIETEQLPAVQTAPRGSSPANLRPSQSSVGTRTSISVIIPVRGADKNLPKCLESLSVDQPAAQIICVYAPSDIPKKLIARIKQAFAHVQTLAFKKGTSIVDMLNAGMSNATSPYICLLQPHLSGENGWLSSLTALHRQILACGIIGPVADDFADPQKPSPLLLHPASENDPMAHLRDQSSLRHAFVHGLDDGCIFFSRAVLNAVGFLDEQFQTQAYAIRDLCRRATAAGYRNAIAGGVRLRGQALVGGGRQMSTAETHTSDRLAFRAKWQAIGGPDAQAVLTVDLLCQIEERLQTGDPSGALDLCHAHSDAIVRHTTLRVRIGSLLQRFGQNEALSKLVGLASSTSHNLEATVLEAYCQIGSGKNEVALRSAKNLLRDDPMSAPAQDLLGIIAFGEGRTSEARDHFTRTIQNNPGYAPAYDHLAALFWSEGLVENAMHAFETAFMIDPSHHDIFTDCHKASVATESYDRAALLFAEACRLYPRHRQLRYLLIDLLIKQERFETALGEIETAMALFGTSDGIVEAALQIRERRGCQQMSRTHSRKNTVSLCMITKDEERHLARCLHSAKPVVDEIIIVDTGSADRTRAIAQAFGARVFDFDWCQDFAAARNYGIDKAQGDLILILDADEVIAPQDHEALTRLFARKESRRCAYSVVTRNYTRLCNRIGWSANDGNYAAEECGTGWTPSEKVRIFPNDPEIRFCYPVHEVVGPALQRKKVTTTACDVPVHHYGQLDQDFNRSKGESYFRIGLKKLAEMGDDEQALTELAVQAELLGKSKEAADLWKRVLAIAPNSVRALVNLSSILGRLGQLTEAAQTAQQAVRQAPHMKEAHFNLSLSLLLLGEVRKAIDILESLQVRFPQYYAAIFMLGCAQICHGDETDGLHTLTGLNGTDLWPVLHHSFDELADNLLRSGRMDYHAKLMQSRGNLRVVNKEGKPVETPVLAQRREAAATANAAA